MTRRQSNNQWSGGRAAHPAPKIQSAKILWKSTRLDFLGSRRHSPHWLSSKEPNYQYGLLLISAGAIEGHFEGKTLRECQQGVLFLHDKASANQALVTQKKLVYLGFQYLDHPPNSPDLAPSDYHLFPGLKKQLKVAIFRPMRRSLLPRRPGWTDNILVFILSGLQKLEQRSKKCIELRGEYVEKIPSFSL